ncbi:MAG: hypothetical protein ACI9AD_001556 [Nitriliruptoraceae bacterium]|jgi:hypothetical protein
MLTHWAAVLAADGHAARRSVLWLHDLAPAPSRPELLVAYGADTRGSHSMQVRRSRTIRPAQLTTTRGMSATTLARASIDLAPQLRHRKLRNLIVDAKRRGLLTVQDVADVRSTLGRGVSGLPIVDGVLAELNESRSDSGFEHEVRAGLFAAGFPVHPAPYPYRCDDGVTVALDVVIPTHWVHIEVDGRRYHSDRQAFTNDRTKWSQIALRWRIVWVTVDRWNDDRLGIHADIRAAMALYEAPEAANSAVR